MEAYLQYCVIFLHTHFLLIHDCSSHIWLSVQQLFVCLADLSMAFIQCTVYSFCILEIPVLLLIIKSFIM